MKKKSSQFFRLKSRFHGTRASLSPHGVGNVGSKESISEQEAGVAAWGQAQHCMTVQATKLTKIW